MNDHKVVLQLLGDGHPVAGIVFHPSWEMRHEEVRVEAASQNVERVLDTCAMQLALPGGVLIRSFASLPWAGSSPHRPETLRGRHGSQLVTQIVDRVETLGYDAVLAPTHYLALGADSQWLSVDLELAQKLRTELDRRGLNATRIYYPLATPIATLRGSDHANRLAVQLGRIDIDAVWLRFHPFGTSNSGPFVLRTYMEAARAIHSVGVPIVGEKTGTVGLALMAFGAVGGIENGITIGERFDVTPLLRPPVQGQRGFSPARIYLAEFGAFITRDQAAVMFQRGSMKAEFGCKLAKCCRHTAIDMLKDPRGHFARRRAYEVSDLAAVPQSQRASVYLDEFLRPATSMAARAAVVLPELETTRRRLESWMGTLQRQVELDVDLAYDLPALGQRRASPATARPSRPHAVTDTS